MKTLRAVIVDDEVSSRRLLVRLLGNHPELLVEGEACSVAEAVKLCRHLRPDVIFLDVQMPQKLGFELVELLEYKLQVVFVTAHLEYTIKAFDLGSCDYLLKPVSAQRLAVTVQRLIDLCFRTNESNPPALLSERLSEDASVVFPLGSAILQVKVAEIAQIQADGRYSRVTLASGKSCVLSKGISHWEKILPVESFLRVSRFLILNRRAVRHFERRHSEESIVTMNGSPGSLILSRRAALRLRRALRKNVRS